MFVNMYYAAKYKFRVYDRVRTNRLVEGVLEIQYDK